MEVVWIVTTSVFAVMCINRAYVLNFDNLLALTVMEYRIAVIPVSVFYVQNSCLLQFKCIIS